jgi:hypothetical protein
MMGSDDTRPAPRNACGGCRLPFDRRYRTHVELGPMVHDHVWQQIADDPDERLCGECMEKRTVKRLGRMPTFADLRPCGWNLFHRPHSWFDLFVEKEGPPKNIAEWRTVIRARTRAEIEAMAAKKEATLRARLEEKYGGDWNAARAAIKAKMAEIMAEITRQRKPR